MSPTAVRLMAAVFLVGGVALMFGLWMGQRQPAAPAPAALMQDRHITVLPEAKPIPAFALLDHDGKPFGPERLRDQWTFLFLGYTHCPDVCPTTLATLARMQQRLAPAPGTPARVVLVSVDPGRDDTARLKEYVTHFHKDFTGVTGPGQEIDKLVSALGAMYVLHNATGEKDYPVDHTAAVFLVDPTGGFKALFSPPLDAAAMAERFSRLQKQWRERRE